MAEENNLENELEYSFVLVPVKNGVPYKSSNIVRLTPSSKYNFKTY